MNYTSLKRSNSQTLDECLKIVIKKPTKDGEHYKIIKTTSVLKDDDDGVVTKNNEDKDDDITIIKKTMTLKW
jgi:hypothetical protein